jgi:hypothetical protein
VTRPLLALLLASLALGSACALGTQRFGRAIDVDRIGELEIGRSTKSDVLRLFGPPTSYSRLPAVPELGAAGEPLGNPDAGADDVFVYEYREDRERFFTAIFYTQFHRAVISDRLMVFFDDADRVRYVAFSKETE